MRRMAAGPGETVRDAVLVASLLLPSFVLPLMSSPRALDAQARRPLPVAPPSRADSLLARGRLRAAEDALYRTSDANPRNPAARGELARYLASRARFVIADVLFAEALRFGADTPSVAQAMMSIAAYRPEVDRRRIPGVRLPAAEAAREAARLAARADAPASSANGAATATAAAVTVPMRFTGDGSGIGTFEVRGPGGTRRALLDPYVQGVMLGRADDAALRPRSFGATGDGAPLLIPELAIGARTLRGVEARVDGSLAPDEIRVGIDVLWPLAPQFDERSGTLTIRMDRPRRTPADAVQIPIALAFPGIWMVPVVGEPPLSIASPRGRALLRESRWWWDASQATLVVER